MISFSQKHDTLIVRVAKINCFESTLQPSISHWEKIDNYQFSSPQLSNDFRHLKKLMEVYLEMMNHQEFFVAILTVI